MSQPIQKYEEITFQQFVLFIKTHSKQIEENINTYLNLEASISETDRKIIEALLQSFLQLLTNPNTEVSKENYADHLDIWLQSQLSILNRKSFNLFQLLFEKSLITLMIQIKYNRISAVLMFLLSIFTYLVQSHNNWADESFSVITNKNPHENRELKRLQLLDKLNKLLIRSSGVQDLPYILKKCEDYFHYKRCVFYAYIPWSNQFYGVIGAELPKVQSMKGQITEENIFFSSKKNNLFKEPPKLYKKEHIKLFNLSSIIFLPLTHKNQLFGWLTFDKLGEEFDCSKEELALLEQVGKRLGLFLSRKGDAAAKNRTQVVASAFRLGLLH